MKPFIRHLVIAPSAALVAISALAIAGASAVARADSSLPNAKSAKTSSPGTAQGGWVSARQKHNASGLLLRYQTPANVKPGQRASVALTIAGVTAADGAQIEIKASDPSMTIMMDGIRLSAPVALKGGEMRRIDVEVLNAPEGLHYLNVFMTHKSRSNVVAIPIRVGHGRLMQKPEGEPQTTPSGEKIIVLPSATK